MTRSAPDPHSPEKGRAVRGMFASIAPRYDLLNRLLSAGQDQRWRRAMVRHLPELRPGDRILDLCTGTGDVTLVLHDAAPDGVRVHGGDFCEEMVALAPAKAAGRSPGIGYLVSDALALPHPDGCVAAVTVAFGLRNVQDPPAALREMGRLLRPGGRLMVLEFARPESRLFAPLYRFYFFKVLPRLGRLLSGSETDAYRYLPESVWAFPKPAEIRAELEQAGLKPIVQRTFLGGAVVLHVAERPEAG